MRSVEDITAYRQLITDMKADDVTGERTATAWARETIARLLNPAGGFTYAVMLAAFVQVYKPVTATGSKPAASAGSLPHMPRGRCSAIKYLLDNLDVAGVAELATEFASPEGAIRSFGAFNALGEDQRRPGRGRDELGSGQGSRYPPQLHCRPDYRSYRSSA